MERLMQCFCKAEAGGVCEVIKGQSSTCRQARDGTHFREAFLAELMLCTSIESAWKNYELSRNSFKLRRGATWGWVWGRAQNGDYGHEQHTSNGSHYDLLA